MNELLEEVLGYYEIDKDGFEDITLRKLTLSEKTRYNCIKANFLLTSTSTFSFFNRKPEPEGYYRVLELEQADGTCHLFYMEIIMNDGTLKDIRELDAYTI